MRRAPGFIEALLLLTSFSTLVEFSIPSLEGLTFFVLGASFGMRGRSLFIGDGQLKWLLTAFLAGEFVNVWLRLQYNIYWIHRPVILIGVVALLPLSGTAIAHRRLTGTLKSLAGMSFFVFAAHEPLMTMLRKLTYRIVVVNEMTIFAIYALLSLLVAALTLAAYCALRRTVPPLAFLLNGMRGQARVVERRSDAG